MNLTDQYFRDTLWDITLKGSWCNNPRTKWEDGTPAYYKSIKQKTFTYDILEGEFPINTFRKTALKGAFYDMDAIYLKQTNIIEEMHPSIHSWWIPFVTEEVNGKRSIGQTYGHTVRRYDLMNKLLTSMETNPEGRRHLINLWQEQQMIEDPKALVPCAFLTEWSVEVNKTINYVDLTLTQRSQDFLMTASINPAQYVMLGLKVCNHLSFKTGKIHLLRIFEHHVQDVHIYDRHMKGADYLLQQSPLSAQPSLSLICEPQDFYSHTWEDFKIQGTNKIKALPFPLEIAI